MKDIYNVLKKIIKSQIFLNEPMCRHTSFKTGGNAELFINIENIQDLITVLDILKKNEVPYYIIGNGSNLLVSDKGVKGAVIQLYDKINEISVEDNIMSIGAGALLSVVASVALDKELSGFEFASGIPGTFGGAVCMNAGAYDGEIKNVIMSASVLTKDLEVKEYINEDLNLRYRKSAVSDEGLIVLSGKIKLEKGNPKDIKERMEYLALQRREKQPINFPSAGSTFKRPDGYFTGKLITDSDLKGYSIGGAQVSDKHAGFIINKGGATTNDILELILHCQTTVFEKFGVTLETEVKFIGEK